MSEPLLRIRNRHGAGCGEPPIINSDDLHLYIGYFENRYGEQWVFTYDRKTLKSELRGGDCGWNTAYSVVDGKVADLILDTGEAAWLQACWIAATGSG
jgi:hypothetical protein